MPAASPRLDQLAIRATGEEVRRASEWLDAACRARYVPQVQVECLVLCLNEALANVLAHGGPAALGAPIDLALEVAFDEGRGSAAVTVSDSGVAFDPRTIPSRSSPGNLEEASLGGLGMVMIRRCSDWIDYRHEGGRNHLTFGARWSVG